MSWNRTGTEGAALFNDLLDRRTGLDGMLAGEGPTQVTALSTRREWEEKAAALRAIYRWTLGEKPADYDRPLDLRVEDEQAGAGLVRRTVSYNVGPEERIRADILVSYGADSRPAVVTIHPTNEIGRRQSIGADTPHDGTTCAYGLDLARRGYVTINYDLLGSGDRIYQGRRSFDNQPFVEQYPDWSGRGKDLHDLSRAIDVLERTPEADARTIGVFGHSQGGGMATDGLAVEARLAAAVNNCGDWPFAISKNPFNRCRNTWWTGQPRLRAFGLTGKPIPIDLHEKLALAAPRPVLNIVALNDFQFDETEVGFTRPAWENLEKNVHRVYALYDDPGGYRQVLHVRGHRFDDSARRTSYAFLDEHLLAPGPIRPRATFPPH